MHRFLTSPLASGHRFLLHKSRAPFPKQRTLFSIKAGTAADIRKHSAFAGEEELILQPGTVLEVLCVMRIARSAALQALWRRSPRRVPATLECLRRVAADPVTGTGRIHRYLSQVSVEYGSIYRYLYLGSVSLDSTDACTWYLYLVSVYGRIHRYRYLSQDPVESSDTCHGTWTSTAGTLPPGTP